MLLRRFLTKNRKAEADHVTTTTSHTLPGRDIVRQSGSSLTDTLDVAEASQVATPNYSKRPYVSNSNSHLWKFC